MDRIRAKRIARELKDRKVGKWTVLDYVNQGKSALVVQGICNGEKVALKIFDPELVERFGRDAQIIRVEREISLIGKKHPNLIEIKDGGECKNTEYIFVAMAYLSEKNLAQVIADLPRNRILPLIKQIASAAKFLEDEGLAHRDIKPENIAISDDFEHATLMDLGVLRPVGFSEITDENEQRVFVGTLRYSPPELLYRKEQDTLEGWRAITFYQLGAVLNDMIMRRQIFHEFGEPYATLVDAVCKVSPVIKANDIDSNLVILVRSCLVKDPGLRLSMVSWKKFLEPQMKATSCDSFREKIRKRIAILGTQQKKMALAIEEDRVYKRFLKLEETVNLIKDIIRTTCLNDRESFPRFQIDQRIESSDTDASIFVCFRPSSPHHLFVAATFVVLISLLDEPDGILDFRFTAFASDDCIIEVGYDNLKAKRFFIGPYEPKIIKDKIDLLLLALIDKCQELEKEEMCSKYGNSKGNLSHPVQLILDVKDLEEASG